MKTHEANVESKTKENYEQPLSNDSSNQKAKDHDLQKKEKSVLKEVTFKNQKGKFQNQDKKLRNLI